MPTTFRAWDDYFIPGTTVLRNKLGATTAADLSAREEFAAQVRLVELAAEPVDGQFDYDHMKEIHRRIFQDVYEWAGQERVGPDTRMTKDGPDVVNYPLGDPAAPTVAYGYYPGPGIADAAANQYRLLEREHHLTGLPREQFVERLAEYWGELNTIHAFREGNTRAQFVFFSELADNAGYRLDAGRFHVGAPLRDEFVAARFYNQATGRSDRLAAVLDRAVTRPDARPQRRAGGSSIERLQQRVEEQRARRRDQFRGGSAAGDERRGPQQGPRR
ncbi:Fic family protein (plasmid) [Curtobacterium sp. MCLR17_007]|uniref:Fic/DOC family protein n=1 Tax=Curtobacterium sp. MCLR17_007 TaxID=2175648 RepID=UPI000DA9E720|nr:Fic family protein [Curtobacterium sp. MCLR17_007]WIB62073.1 Fic family protein [Curtobacterium sp. MCLR17_007]